MTTSQTNTVVNARASSGDPMPKLKGKVLPGGSESVQDNGGPTNTNYKATDDSSKLDHHEPSQSKTVINDKGGGTQKTGGGTGKTSISDSGYGDKHDGTKGRSGPGPDKLSKEKVSYEHTEIDDEAGNQLDELSDSNDASDEFKERARIIFEAALNEKLQLEVARLEEEFSTRFEEEITSIAEKVESFLNYTADQWLEENKLVVENGIRNQLAESFVQGLRSLFTDHYVTLPDEKYDIFESMVTKLDEMEDKLNSQIEANMALNEQLSEYQRDSILVDVSRGMSEVARDRLASLAESVEFESEDIYRKKLGILKESYLTASTEDEETELLEESASPLQADPMDEIENDAIAAYARALTRISR
jgi:hypothetical protein